MATKKAATKSTKPAKKKATHGGKRVAGPGKKIGRPKGSVKSTIEDKARQGKLQARDLERLASKDESLSGLSAGALEVIRQYPQAAKHIVSVINLGYGDAAAWKWEGIGPTPYKMPNPNRDPHWYWPTITDAEHNQRACDICNPPVPDEELFADTIAFDDPSILYGGKGTAEEIHRMWHQDAARFPDHPFYAKCRVCAGEVSSD